MLARTSALLVRVSPAGAFDGLATRMLGTSVVDEARLRRDVRRHTSAILPLLFDQQGAGAEVEYPVFTESRASLGEVLADGRADLAAIVMIGALATMVLFVALNRYDIR